MLSGQSSLDNKPCFDSRLNWSIGLATAGLLLIHSLSANAQSSSLLAPAASTAQPVISVGHTQGVRKIAIAPDGQWLASVGGDRTLKIWDVAGGRMLRNVAAHEKQINWLRISDDGKLILTSSEDKTTKIWNAETGTLVRTIKAASDISSPYGVEFAERNQLITNDMGDLNRWDLTSGRRLGLIARKAEVLAEFSLPVSMALSPDHRTVALGYMKSFRRPVARVTIVEVGSGRTMHTLDSHTDGVDIVVFSPDGRLLASGGQDKTIRLWDVTTGRLVQTFAGHPNSVMEAVFSPDGKRLYTIALVDKAIRVWDVSTGSLIKKFDTPQYWSTIDVSPDGKTLITGGDDIGIWDANDGSALRLMQGKSADRSSAALFPAPEGRFYVRSGGIFQLWNSADGGLLRNSKQEYLDRVAMPGPNTDGQWLHITKSEKELTIWDVTTGEVVSKQAVPNLDKLRLFDVSPNGRLVALQAQNGKSFIIWDIKVAKRLYSISTPYEFVFQPKFSPDSRWLISSTAQNSDAVRIWDMSNGRLSKTIQAKDLPYDMSYSPDGRLILGANTSLRIMDAATNRILWNTEGQRYDVEAAIFTPDSRLIVAGDRFSSELTVWDVASGRMLRTLDGNTGNPASLLFLQEGKKLAVGNANGTSTIWDFERGKLLTTTVHAQSGEWLTITPEGFFAASDKGAELLHLVRGFEITGIDQVYQALYRPDLVREKLSGDTKGLVREAAARLDLDKVLASGLAPQVSILSPQNNVSIASESANAEIQLADAGGGIGRIEWRVNGVTLGVDEAGQVGKLSRTLPLDEGDNVLEVVAYNAKNLVASTPVRLTIKSEVASKTAPRLFVISVGINDYFDGRLKLNFPAADARALSVAFEATGKGLYDAVETVTILDADVTKAKLEAAFASIAPKVRPRDVFVFFIAGHGKTVDGRYYFIPQDFRYDGERSIVERGISQGDFQGWLSKVSAKKSVLLFDTCESGSLTGDKIATRGLELVASLERLTRAMGRTVLSASTDDTPALEGYRGHGVFTYALLEALERGDVDGNGFLEVTELASHIDHQVPKISQEAFNFRQIPQMKLMGSNFPLAKPASVLAEANAAPIVPRRPTHVAIRQAQVFAEPSDSNPTQTLSPGAQVALIRSEQGWAFVARDGRQIGFVAAADLVALQ